MAENKLTLEEVARYPRPGLAGPKLVSFSPDSRKITYLFSQEGGLVQQLWAYDIATGSRQQLSGGGSGRVLSREEELRRERTRTREVGVTSYQFAPLAIPQLILIPLEGSLYLKRGDDAPVLIEDTQGAQDARLNPAGTKVAFVREDELFVADLIAGTGSQLTSGAGGGITNGLAEYIAQEEMGRSEGYWWNGDGTKIAYVQADSRHIPKYPIAHLGKENFEVEVHRYPFAGQANARVKLGVIAAEGGPTQWLDLADEEDIYLARVAWRPDGSLTAQVEDRRQHYLRLLTFNLANGEATVLIEESREPWINLNDDTRFLKTGEILWNSERSGFAHLYLFDNSGQLIRQLTSGDWMVTGVVGVDEQQRQVYFIATKDGVTERHLYRVSLDGGEIARLTEQPGWHSAVISPDFRYFINHFNSLEEPPSVKLRSLDGQLVTALHEEPNINPAKLGLNPPQLTSFQNRDGITLHAAIYQPDDKEPGRRYPLIVYVYGGPHAQRVMNHWELTVDLRSQYLAQNGYIVVRVDNRGSANRGLAFEGVLAWNMGNVEVRDQVDGVRFMAQRPDVDGARVGIYGWSYGGYMTLMSLMCAPEVFKVGVAGAPVTSWDGYDTHYTERYMGLPGENPNGYELSSVMTHVDKLAGKLLLIHGMVDENVHFRHTTRLITALTTAQKTYDLVVYPEERHMPRDAKGLEYQERRLVDYFNQYLFSRG